MSIPRSTVMKPQTLIALCSISLSFTNAADAKPIEKVNPKNFRPRATGPTLGLGVGVSVPSDQLDTFILRIRMNENLTIELMINYNQFSSSEETISTFEETDPETGEELGNTTTSSTVVNTDLSSLGGGLMMRYRFGKRGNTDLNAIAGIGYLQYSTETTTEGVQGKDLDSGSTLSVNAGMGMENYFAPKWSAGFDVTTPVYQNGITSNTPRDSITESTVSSTTTGLSFAPTFRIMLAHYF